MSDDWDDHAAGWDGDPAARAYAEQAHRSLVDALAAFSMTIDGLRVLDFGCGTGLLTERLASSCRAIDAVDTSVAMLAVLDDKVDRNAWTHVSSNRSLSTAGDGYDLIVCSSVCSFLDDYPDTAAELARRLVPGGAFVQWDWERDDHDGDPHGLSRAEITGALTAAGLDAVEVCVGFELAFGEHTMRPLMGTGRRPHDSL